MTEISPFAKVLIVMNNYFHDVATAMLLASALILLVLYRAAKRDGGAAHAWLAALYPHLSRVAWGSLLWIVVGGIPRTIFFQEVEWNLADPSNEHLFTALMVKHGLMWVAVALGVVLWARVRKLSRDALGE